MTMDAYGRLAQELGDSNWCVIVNNRKAARLLRARIGPLVRALEAVEWKG